MNEKDRIKINVSNPSSKKKKKKKKGNKSKASGLRVSG